MPDYDEAIHDQGKSRRPRGWLSTDVKRITDYWITGQLEVLDDKLTPYRIKKAFIEIEGLTDAPSSGAIAEVLKRWERWGFAVIERDPIRFIDYTEKGRELGLKACEDAYNAARELEKAQK